MEKNSYVLNDKPSVKEISVGIGRYNIVINVLGLIIDKIEEKNKGDNRWFIFSEKIGRKFLTQAYTLQHILANDIFIVQGDKEKRFIDSSSLSALIRVQLETYAVFYHLFVDHCNMEEKIIRFRLWELDGLRTRQKYSRPDDSLIKEKLEKERHDIENCISVINQFSYFQNLDSRDQEYLLKNAVWRFNDNSLKNRDKRKKRLTVEQMILNTGIKESLFEDWYAFISTHAHTMYWSVVQNATLTEDEKIISEYVIIMQATFLTSFFIKDFCKIYVTANDIFISLSEGEKQVIDSFELRGRETKRQEICPS